MGLAHFFKKEEEPKVELPTITPLEVGKEVTFKDPKTGEFIYQRALSADQRKSIMTIMQKNGQLANQFIGVCRQEIAIGEQKLAVVKAIADSEKEINDIVNKVRDDLKLDKRWGLNMQLGCLERRDPPDGT